MRFNQRSNLPWFHWWSEGFFKATVSYIKCVSFHRFSLRAMKHSSTNGTQSDREMPSLKKMIQHIKNAPNSIFWKLNSHGSKARFSLHSTYTVIETTWKILISSFPPFLRELIWNFSPIDGALRSLPTSSSFVFFTTLCCHHYNCSFTENWIDFSSSIEQLFPLSLFSSPPHSCAFQHTREWKVERQRKFNFLNKQILWWMKRFFSVQM